MQKSIFYIALYMAALYLACSGEILAQSRTYTVSIDSVKSTAYPGYVVAYGYTLPPLDEAEKSELEIVHGEYVAKISFNDQSKILSNWALNPEKYTKDWGTIMAYYDSLSIVGKLLRQTPIDDPGYKNLQQRHGGYTRKKNALLDAWGEDMEEMLGGSIGIYDAKNKISLKTFYISNGNFEYSIAPSSIIILSKVIDAQLQFFFLVDKEALPEIFDKIFPAPKVSKK